MQWAIFANSPIFMDPPDSGRDLVVASRCLLDHKSSQEATLRRVSQSETDHFERIENLCSRTRTWSQPEPVTSATTGMRRMSVIRVPLMSERTGQ
ncbi:hypothetical protein BN2475_340026 [Paraburkholderia ribeironis]|uniref:Uncharacterized protein n=1 Tax=Paraburkholderia ribeironis TaxID=1247936 RepID=A0A1N7S3N2_9BURK|nr:hypothetical protein BN2475_340026 [Paraburkholderia ribeironis]